MRYVLGIDQGGSKTHALIGDEQGNVLGMGTSGGAVHSVHGMSQAMSAVQEAVERASMQAQIDISQISACAAGMSGLDWKEEEEVLHKSLVHTLGVKNLTVVNDCIIAMRGGSNKPTCAVICAGSGLNSAVQNSKGETFVYGYYIPDSFQGGMALGKTTLQRVIDAAVGLAQPTMLTNMMLEYFNTNSIDSILQRRVGGKITSRDYLHFPIFLEEAGEVGDSTALSILADFGLACGQFIVNAMRHLNILGESPDVVISGGIFKCSVPILKDAVTFEVHRHAPHAQIIDAFYEPVAGAYQMGLEMIHKEIPDLIISNLRASSEKFPISRN